MCRRLVPYWCPGETPVEDRRGCTGDYVGPGVHTKLSVTGPRGVSFCPRGPTRSHSHTGVFSVLSYSSPHRESKTRVGRGEDTFPFTISLVPFPLVRDLSREPEVGGVRRTR